MEAEEEDKHLRHVETALLQLLNDDIDEADKILKEHESSYHFLGRGISSFLSSMLGGEKEMVKEALNKLLASETKNWDDMKKAQKDSTAYRSKIYPAGTEYLLCYCVSQLTSAICGVMSGSVTEAVKGFYKLRKAFQTLDGILQIESEYLRTRDLKEIASAELATCGKQHDSGAEDDLTGYPKERCRALLKDMRARYPESKLWRMEEARMQGFDRQLGVAIKILESNAESKMKQIAAINLFEMSFTSMFMHDYELSIKCWMKCAELSKWSPAMISDPDRAKKEKALAEKYIRKAPPLAGKQKVMSKELPFDTYITRKVQKWEDRAKNWKVDLADATGVSPFSEMIYLWNGSRKQNQEELEKSLKSVQWERTTHPEKFENDVDENAIHALVASSVWKNMGKFDDARASLQNNILSHDRQIFKRPLYDDWTPASAHYEIACLDWAEKDLPTTSPDEHKKKVLSCEQELLKTQKFEHEEV
ncbi:putative Mitochondrial outer membrane protein iml2 [Glarea lozoyensis 74030]|uniref:Inclusion body clearance protein IML2 n=1 Tax=Glarea lozoyensis (strain ATCC 74030 / MF5533) TaxID=1104152 RepID=H0EG62_GLAL7|nr:putative Mitochondrial outer membrane protein iml2 [Glarea lozoyensis 74030]